jgi:pilus assembly protein CpaC
MNGSFTNARCLLGGLLLSAALPSLGAARTAPQADLSPQAAAAASSEHSVGAAPCRGEAAKPAQLALQIGRSTMLRLPEAITHRSVGNPAVVQAMLVSPDTLYLAGVDIGTTNMIVQGRSGICSVVDIVVAMDPAGLQATLATVMPEERDIKVLAAADSLVLTGTVSDAVAVARAVELANAYVRRPPRPLAMPSTDGVDLVPSLWSDGKGIQSAQPFPLDNGRGTTSTLTVKHSDQQNQSQTTGNSATRVVNLLAVSAPQQVQLEVKIAEVSKTLLESLEASAALRFGGSGWAASVLSNFLSGNLAAGLTASHNNGKQQLSVAAQKTDGVVRVLAEPNVMAISGQEGSFLAGGKFYIPIAQDNNRITLEEKEFGIGLRFTPTVLSGGRINLHVAPEVSELSRDGIGVTAGATGATAVMPVVTTRRASTTVQLYDGQSFAIGGLIKNNLTTNLKGLPVLSEVPILGALFRSSEYQQDLTELVFVVTVHLVKPQASTNYVLPTDKVGLPSVGAVILGGRLEGAAPATTTAADSTPAVTPAVAQSAGGFELK